MKIAFLATKVVQETSERDLSDATSSSFLSQNQNFQAVHLFTLFLQQYRRHRKMIEIETC